VSREGGGEAGGGGGGGGGRLGCLRWRWGGRTNVGLKWNGRSCSSLSVLFLLLRTSSPLQFNSLLLFVTPSCCTPHHHDAYSTYLHARIHLRKRRYLFSSPFSACSFHRSFSSARTSWTVYQNIPLFYGVKEHRWKVLWRLRPTFPWAVFPRTAETRCPANGMPAVSP
jgi:hypothetical protein